MLYILTLNWEGADKLAKLYPTLINSLSGVDFKWLIRDHGSNDDSLKVIKNWNNDNVIAIDYKHNRDNFSEGCNFLFKEANPKDEDFILLLNNDVIFNDILSIKNMLSIFEKDNGVGIVGCKLNFMHTNKLQHAGVIFSNKSKKLPFHFRLNEIEDRYSKLNREFQAVTGACLITTGYCYRNANDKYPGMDPKYFWAFDDIDLCLSIKYNLNKKIVYCGQTNIFHEESASLKKNPVNKLFFMHNINYFLNKWYNKYVLDYELYLNDNNYNLYNGKNI
jgi:GT2 family glycosyltransferase